MVFSLTGVSLAYLLFHWALDYASVIQVATLVSTIPIFVGLSNLLINRQSISGTKWLTGIAAVLGVALLITDGYLDQLFSGGGSLIGVVMSLGCAALVALYPPDSFESNVARYQAMATDVSFTCPALAFAGLVAQGFAYHYTYVSDSNPLGLGATHGSELAFLFAHAEDGLAIETESTERSEAFSAEVQRVWAEFARTGDPGDAFVPFTTDGTVTILDDTIEAVTEIRAGRCDQVNALR